MEDIEQIRKKHQEFKKIAIGIIGGLILALVIVLLFIKPDHSKFEPERRRLNDLYATQVEKVSILQRDTVRLTQRIRELENRVLTGKTEIRYIIKNKPDPKTEQIADFDSTFRKIYPVPDSLIFSKGSKSTYVVHIQKQLYEGVVQNEYLVDLNLAMAKTLQDFDSLVNEKNKLIGHQKQVIAGKDDIIETLLHTQVNDMKEISVLRKKKKRNSVLMKVAIPAALVGGVLIGSKL